MKKNKTEGPNYIGKVSLGEITIVYTPLNGGQPKTLTLDGSTIFVERDSPEHLNEKVIKMFVSRAEKMKHAWNPKNPLKWR